MKEEIVQMVLKELYEGEHMFPRAEPMNTMNNIAEI